MWPPHLRKRITNAPPILGFLTLTTFLAVERSLRGDCARLVSVQTQEMPGIVMDFGHLHRGSSPFDGRHVQAALRKLGRWPVPITAILPQRDVRDKVSCLPCYCGGKPGSMFSGWGWNRPPELIAPTAAGSGGGEAGNPILDCVRPALRRLSFGRSVSSICLKGSLTDNESVQFARLVIILPAFQR